MATTISVGNFSSIQAAINAAAAGDTILVAPGTYNENITINKAITLLSTDGRDVTIINGVVTGPQEATVTVGNGVDDVRIGALGQGFTIVGFDKGTSASENAAVYLLGGNDNLTIQGDDIRANGDEGLLSVYGTSLHNIVIDQNIFSGQTFVGSNPAGGNQFTVSNVARPLVFLGTNNAAPSLDSNISFTNNQITGRAGDATRGNVLVNIDASASLISGNLVTGFTSSAAEGAIRARGPDIDIINNTLDDRTGGNSSGIFVDNKGTPGTYSGNVFLGGPGGEFLLYFTPGSDTANGGSGNDLLRTQAGDDGLIGGPGNDTLDGGAGGDTAFFSGPRGAYSVTFANGDFTVTDLRAGSPDGTDTVRNVENFQFSDATFSQSTVLTPPAAPPPPPLFTPGDDDVTLGSGDDTGDALAGNDIVRGEGGNDTLYGNDGDDRLFGGTGDDHLFGGRGNDELQGDDGNDELHGEDGDDRMFGGNGDDRMGGGEGNDRMFGQSGNDTMSGGNAEDEMHGEDGDDRMFGDGGNDRLFGGGGNDYMQGGDSEDELFGGQGTDQLFGNDGHDRLSGEEGNDRLEGGRGNDSLFGGSGEDQLFGGDGADRLFGQEGHDRLEGGEGDDRLDGGVGDDVLNGGIGSDTFVFTGAFRNDRIEDFRADDIIEVDRGRFGDFSSLLNRTSDIGGNAVIDGGEGNIITVLGVAKASFVADDFHFV